MEIWAALIPPAARETGRAWAARAAFWMAVAAVVLRAPVGWRREGPDMAPSGGSGRIMSFEREQAAMDGGGVGYFVG